MIIFGCASCQKKLSVKDELAGHKVQCPGCGQVTLVPRPAVAPSVVSPQTVPSVSLDQGPRNVPPAQPSLPDLPTAPPPSFSDVTEAPLAGQSERPTSLTDFLAPPQAADELGRLGGFRILKVLGHGGMGVVFQGEDPRLGRKVAIKAMLPHLAGSKSAQQRFLREARTAAALEHDHIVPILQVGEDRGAPFIVMPFLKGEPLDKRLQREGKLAVAEILRIGREVAKGLDAAHRAGLIHRDIKPANLWLEAPEGRVKILDFGLARVTQGEQHLTQSGAILGTPSYMAPEQAQTTDIDARADLFSLGVVLYRFCTGVLPFRGHDTMSTLLGLATHHPAPPKASNPGIPQALSDLVMQLLAKDPAARPASAAQVISALQAIEKRLAEVPTATIAAAPAVAPSPFAGFGSTGTIIAPVGKPGRSARPDRPAAPASKGHMPLLVALGGLVAAVVVLAVIVLWPRSSASVSGEGDRAPVLTAAGAEDPLPKTFTNRLAMEFVLVPRGKAWLGGGGGKPGTSEVAIPYDFYLGKYEVTQEDWQKVMGNNPSYYSRTGLYAGPKIVADVADADLKRFPVEYITWDDAQLFLKALNVLDKQAGWVYRLPTEGEWEYACRGGPMTDPAESAFHFSLEKPANVLLPSQASFGEHKGTKRPCKVGSYPPNRLGLFDMHGNVREWCADVLVADDGTPRRPLRGGCFGDNADWCRATSRHLDAPSRRSLDCTSYGMRVARVPAGRQGALVKAPPDGPPPPQPPAAEFFATVKKVEFSKDGATLRINKGTTKQPAQDETLAVDEKVKVVELTRKVLGRKVKLNTGDPLDGGLKHAVFTSQARCQLVTNDKELVTEIRVFLTGFGRRPKNEDPLERPAGKTLTYTNRLAMEFVLVPRGKAWLGGVGGKVGNQEVDIPYDFYLGKYEVTQEQWEKIMGPGTNPSRFARSDQSKEVDWKRFPVENVSWNDCQQLVKRLNELAKRNGEPPGWVYRLPKETEWEYACRGGPGLTKADYGFDFYLDVLTNTPPTGKVSCQETGLGRPRPVGCNPPNRLGLYDMHGNVWEWCDDVLGGEFPVVFRGGSWSIPVKECRATDQVRYHMSTHFNDIGCRLARVPVGK
jgi:formylglycine-generating enzyme required for sulfatase activity/predicted Ser/Thr protein kinase